MTDPSQDRRWSLLKLGIVLYPFVAGAVAINLFLLSLMGQAIDLPVIPPVWAVILGIILGIPMSWPTAAWVRRLMDEADGR